MEEGQIVHKQETKAFKRKYASYFKIYLNPLEEKDLPQFVRMKKEFFQFMVQGSNKMIV